MFASRDQPDGLDELVPGLALSRQRALACRRQTIEAEPALARFLDPGSLDPAALLEAAAPFFSSRLSAERSMSAISRYYTSDEVATVLVGSVVGVRLALR